MVYEGCQVGRRPLLRHLQRFRGGLVFKAHRFLYHLTLGLRVIKKKVCRRLLLRYVLAHSTSRSSVQDYLAYKKPPPRRTTQ